MKQPVSDRRLRKWLADDPARLEQYLEQFPAETERIDELTAISAATRSRIDEVYVAPLPALEAIKAHIAAQRPGMSPTTLLGDMVAGALTTASILFIDDEETPT
jgi:hypothetical protein